MVSNTPSATASNTFRQRVDSRQIRGQGRRDNRSIETLYKLKVWSMETLLLRYSITNVPISTTCLNFIRKFFLYTYFLMGSVGLPVLFLFLLYADGVPEILVSAMYPSTHGIRRSSVGNGTASAKT
jgi:hypothetical protein